MLNRSLWGRCSEPVSWLVLEVRAMLTACTDPEVMLVFAVGFKVEKGVAVEIAGYST